MAGALALGPFSLSPTPIDPQLPRGGMAGFARREITFYAHINRGRGDAERQDGKGGGPAGIISPSRKNYIRTQRQRSAFAKADIRPLAVSLRVPPPFHRAIRVIIMRMSPPLAPSPALGWIRERHALCASLRLSVRKNMNASGGIRGGALPVSVRERTIGMQSWVRRRCSRPGARDYDLRFSWQRSQVRCGE